MVPGAEYNAMRSTCLNATQTSTEQFLLKKVMRLSSGFDEVDTINVDSLLVIAICWFAGFLAVSKGIRSYAKVATFGACASYALMFMLFLASVVQRGSTRGLHAYFRTEWEKLGDVRTWRSATQQLLYSTGLGIGLVTCYASYKPFAWPLSPNIVKLIISDFVFSLLSGCVALSLSGHATTLYGIDLEDIVVSDGLPGDGNVGLRGHVPVHKRAPDALQLRHLCRTILLFPTDSYRRRPVHSQPH
ncbi:creatine transporter-like isoform X2 [Dermacentor andersoni]|nr:uncharacterized protein LOC126537746 isoform X2 [Dermacentor andersoni]